MSLSHDEGAQEKAEALLREFCLRFQLDTSGNFPFFLTVDSFQVALEFDSSRDMLFITVPMGDVAEEPAGLFRKLLYANLFRHASCGAVFCLDGVSGRVVVQAELSLSEMTWEVLKKRLEGCIQAAESWRNRLSPSFREEQPFCPTDTMIRV